MAKTSQSWINKTEPTRRSRRWLWLALLLVVSLPLLADGLELTLARWRSMIHQPAHAATPALDAIRFHAAALHNWCRLRFTSTVRDPTWHPGSIIALVMAWAAIVGLLLRGNRR